MKGNKSLLDIHRNIKWLVVGFRNTSITRRLTIALVMLIIPFLGNGAINHHVRPELAEGRLWQYTAPSNRLGITK